jgi:hypothetical protein
VEISGLNPERQFCMFYTSKCSTVCVTRKVVYFVSHVLDCVVSQVDDVKYVNGSLHGGVQ